MVVILIVCDLVQGIVPNALIQKVGTFEINKIQVWVVQKVRTFKNHATIEQYYGEKRLNALTSYQMERSRYKIETLHLEGVVKMTSNLSLCGVIYSLGLSIWSWSALSSISPL